MRHPAIPAAHDDHRGRTRVPGPLARELDAHLAERAATTGDTASTAAGVTVAALAAELERELIRERTLDGLRSAAAAAAAGPSASTKTSSPSLYRAFQPAEPLAGN